VRLYRHPDRQTDILNIQLPDLLSAWEDGPTADWWFLRYREPEPHLRLRIWLHDALAYGSAAQHFSAWTERLRRFGLLRNIVLDTYYPEIGRYGTVGDRDEPGPDEPIEHLDQGATHRAVVLEVDTSRLRHLITPNPVQHQPLQLSGAHRAALRVFHRTAARTHTGQYPGSSAGSTAVGLSGWTCTPQTAIWLPPAYPGCSASSATNRCETPAGDPPRRIL